MAYTKERKAFGKPIIDFQNTRFKLAEMQDRGAMSAQRLRRRLRRTAARRASSTSPTAAMAKWWMTELQCEVVDECLQFFGGYGYMEEYPIARALRRRPRAEDLRRHQRDHEGTDRTHALASSVETKGDPPWPKPSSTTPSARRAARASKDGSLHEVTALALAARAAGDPRPQQARHVAGRRRGAGLRHRRSASRAPTSPAPRC